MAFSQVLPSDRAGANDSALDGLLLPGRPRQARQTGQARQARQAVDAGRLPVGPVRHRPTRPSQRLMTSTSCAPEGLTVTTTARAPVRRP